MPQYFCEHRNDTNEHTLIFSKELCKDLHRKIDVVDEERYDIAAKVSKNEAEVSHATTGKVSADTFIHLSCFVSTFNYL